MKESKVWGVVDHLFAGPVSVSLLEVKANTYCSIHKHEHRINCFRVISGKLHVVLYEEYEHPEHEEPQYKEVARIPLAAGDLYDVPVGVFHRFEVIQAGKVVEIYWTTDGSHVELHDIFRVKKGGEFTTPDDRKEE